MTLPEEETSTRWVWGRFAMYILLIAVMASAFAFYSYQLVQLLYPRFRL
jgi:hypothetical protein